MQFFRSIDRDNPWVVLFAVALGLFMVVIDISILSIALPSIAGDFNASLAQVEWALIAYTLVLTGLVPVFGRISDVIGRKRLFILGVLIFGFASLLAAFSTSILWLIGARVIQAVGGGLITTNTLAIITDVFPAGKRGAAMGVQAILMSGGAAVGPTLGGFLVTHFGWASVFLINVPVGVLAAIVAAVFLPPLKSNRAREPLDWVGGVLLMAGMGTLLLGMSKGPDWGWDAPKVLILIVVGIVLLGAFLRQELRNEAPLVDLTLFKIREFATGQLAGLFATLAMATVMLLFPFYWQSLRGYSAESAGLLMMPLPATLMVVAPLAGRFSDAVGTRGIASAGLAAIMLGLFLISGITADMPVWEVLVRVTVLGVGLGMFMAPNNNAVMSAVPPNRRGIASGLLGMFRFTGQSLGVSFAGTAFASFAVASGFSLKGLPSPETIASLKSDPATLELFQQAFINGMHAAALFAVPLAGIGLILSLMRGSTEEQIAERAREPQQPVSVSQGDHS